MSLAEIKQQVEKLTPAERNELLAYLDQRPIRDRARKLSLASDAMKRMDRGEGVPLDRTWMVGEDEKSPAK